jgi:3',5'-nucleoside bisphosphate phosphatase
MISPLEHVDLHVHSTASDGTLSPGELVALALDRRITILSITDHDTVDGIPEAVEAARELDVELIPGVELSVDLEHEGFTAHLLGYFPRTPVAALTDPSTDFGRAIAFVQGGRSARNPRILEKLRGLGMPIDMDIVENIAGGDVIGRPHIAEAMVSAGYVGDSAEAFSLYLAKGKPAYSDRDRLVVSDAVRVIRRAGGLPVLAHPGYIGLGTADLEALVSVLKSLGLAGLEVFYPGHDAATTEQLLLMAGKMALVTTGGTDFHGWRAGAVELGGTPADFHVTRDMIDGFLALCDGISETEAG